MPPIAQAGAITVRTDRKDPQFLLVRAKQNPDHWIFPKGHIEVGETAEQAAVRELREEAGVRGNSMGRVGASALRSGEEDVEVTYYLIRFEAHTRANEQRSAQWLRYSEARQLLSFDDAKQLLDRASAMLGAR